MRGEGERERMRERERECAHTWEKESEKERERERERECTHAGERVLEKALGLLLLYVFPPPGPALCKLGLARSPVCSA